MLIVLKPVLGPVNQLKGGQLVPVKLVLKEVFNQGQDGAEMVLREDKPGAGGSRNLPINSWAGAACR